MKRFLRILLLVFILLTGEFTFAQIINTVAGNGTQGFTGDGGPATSAELNSPQGLAFDAIGNMYITDVGNNRIRKVDASGLITTVAGTGTAGFGGDGGSATAALLNFPIGIVFDVAGNYYICEYFNNRIRKVSTAGIITTFAGNGGGYSGDGGLATAAGLNPTFATFDVAGNMFVADFSNHRIRKISTSGIITTIAGTGTAGFSGDGGLATAASINSPHGIAFDASGNIYIADFGNNRIRKINTSGIITTIVGTGTAGFSGDGGPATAAQLNIPTGISFDASGNLFISERINNRVRKVNTSGVISTIAGNGLAGFSGDGGTASLAKLNVPEGLTFDASGNLYIFDSSNNRIRKVYTANTGTTCPGAIPLAGIDTLGINTIFNGATVACNATPFYVYVDYSAGLVDSVTSIYTPTYQVNFDTYQSSLGSFGEIAFYDNGTFLSCLGPSAPCTLPIGYNGTIGSRWTVFKCKKVNGNKQHEVVFSTTAAIPTTTVTIKSACTNTIFNTFVWSAAGVSTQTVTLPANANIGNCMFNISPAVSNSLAVNDLQNGYYYVNPQMLPLGTYTLTYTFTDPVCTGKSTNFIFTVGKPNVTWTAPQACTPGTSISLNSTLSASAQTIGTWTGTGVSGGVFNPNSTGVGTYTVTYTVGSGTCSNTQSHPVSVNATPTITVSSSSVCPGFSSTLTASGASSYTWSPATGLSSTTGASVIANPTVSTSYVVTGTSNFCTSSKALSVTVFPKPVASYNANPATALISSPAIIFSDQSSGAVLSLWRWYFGDGGNSLLQNPSYTYTAIGSYQVKLIITSVNGCKDSTTRSVDIIADNITVYNSFSPNGDGLNDIFEIDNIDQFGGNHVYIYNRWGQLLWDKSGYDNKNVVWDGKDVKGNVLSAGTYFYIIEVNGKKTEKSWVELTK